LTISQEDAMKIRSVVAAANIGFMFLLVLGIKAEAAELKVLSAIGMQSVMEDLGPRTAKLPMSSLLPGRGSTT